MSPRSDSVFTKEVGFGKEVDRAGIPLAASTDEADYLVVVTGGYSSEGLAPFNGPHDSRKPVELTMTVVNLKLGEIVGTRRMAGAKDKPYKHFVIPGPGSGEYNPFWADWHPVPWSDFIAQVASVIGGP